MVRLWDSGLSVGGLLTRAPKSLKSRIAETLHGSKGGYMTNSLARTNGGRTQSGSRAVPWTPYQDLFGFDPFQAVRSNWAFDYDVSRTETGYEIEVPVPGYNPSRSTSPSKTACCLSMAKVIGERSHAPSACRKTLITIILRHAYPTACSYSRSSADRRRSPSASRSIRTQRVRDVRRAVAFDDAATCGPRAPILFDDAPNVIEAWMKLYRFGLPALN